VSIIFLNKNVLSYESVRIVNLLTPIFKSGLRLELYSWNEAL